MFDALKDQIVCKVLCISVLTGCMVPALMRFYCFVYANPVHTERTRESNHSVRKFARFGTIRMEPTTHARYGNIGGRDQELTFQAAITDPVFRQTGNLAQSGIMKKILSLSLSLTLVACSSGLPELKYADGSTRIPVNPKPIPLPATIADTAKPAAKHGCHRPPEKEKAIGFKGLDGIHDGLPQSQLTLYQ